MTNTEPKEMCQGENLVSRLRRLLPLFFAAGVFVPRLVVADGPQWTNLVSGGPLRDVFSLAIEPTSRALYAGTRVGIFKSIDRGTSWVSINEGLPNADIYEILVDPSSPSMVYVGTAAGVFKTTSAGAAWVSINSGLSTPQVTALAIDRGSPATLYAGTFGGGIFKSIDGGSSWRTAGSGLTRNHIYAIAIDPVVTTTLYAGVVDGIFKSTDGGASWVRVYPSGLGLSFSVGAFAIAAGSPRTIYAGLSSEGVSTGQEPPPGGIIKSADGGTTWTEVNNGLPNLGVSTLVIDPTDPSTVYAGTVGRQGCLTCPAGGVFKSENGGAGWMALDSGLVNPSVSSLALDADMPKTLYAGTYGRGIFRLREGMALACAAGPATLCLNGARFRVQVQWRAASGASGAGQAVPGTADTGYFWFFNSTNIELVVKVLDGRPINGRLWVFYGALSNVEYTITVTDTETGASKTYFNSQGRLGSGADTSAF